MRFSAAYAGYTVCAPSRTTFITGRNSGRIKGAPGDYPNLPQLLKNGGYITAAVGKSAPMDLLEQSYVKELQWGPPRNYGFDIFYGTPNQTYCKDMYPLLIWDNDMTVPLPLNRGHKSRDLCMAHPERFNYTSDMYTNAASAFLRTRGIGDVNPFFLYVALTVPHTGWWGEPSDLHGEGQPVPSDFIYANRTGWPQVERDHAAAVFDLDRRVGHLMTVLKEQGLEEDTVIFFASDNGAHSEGGHDVHFFDSTGGLRGFKRSFYEGGIRSPSLVRWPGVVKPGSISHTPWAFWDALPTMLDIGGIPLPKGASFDGRSIVPALRGQEMSPPEYMYWTWHKQLWDPNATVPSHDDHPAGYSVRVGHWKGVVQECAFRNRPSTFDEMELYNLSSDPFEKTDVSGQFPVVAERIKKIIMAKELSCSCWQC